LTEWGVLERREKVTSSGKLGRGFSMENLIKKEEGIGCIKADRLPNEA